MSYGKPSLDLRRLVDGNPEGGGDLVILGVGDIGTGGWSLKLSWASVTLTLARNTGTETFSMSIPVTGAESDSEQCVPSEL